MEMCFPSAKEAQAIAGAAGPEFGAKHLRRSSTSIDIKNKALSINIKAEDAVALRATANSCLNSVILAKKVSEV